VSARAYRQGNDYVPHDARVHERGTGKTRLETLIALGRKPVLVPEHKIEDGINAGHEIFKRVWFDESRCAPGLEALRQYRVDYDEKLRPFKKTPKEDWTRDAADAFRYVAMAWREIVGGPGTGAETALRSYRRADNQRMGPLRQLQKPRPGMTMQFPQTTEGCDLLRREIESCESYRMLVFLAAVIWTGIRKQLGN
jgi:hypothetical protein